MFEKTSTAVQTAPSRPPVRTAQQQNIFERMDHLKESISRRAFDLFEKDGRVDGRNLDHWLEAEREFLHPVHIRIQENETEFTVRAEVPGFTAGDVEVNVEPRRLTISGNRESRQEHSKGNTTYVETCANEIFRTIDLPSEVNTTKVTATLKDGLLEVQLPKDAADRVAATNQA